MLAGLGETGHKARGGWDHSLVAQPRSGGISGRRHNLGRLDVIACYFGGSLSPHLTCQAGQQLDVRSVPAEGVRISQVFDQICNTGNSNSMAIVLILTIYVAIPIKVCPRGWRMYILYCQIPTLPWPSLITGLDRWTGFQRCQASMQDCMYSGRFCLARSYRHS